MRPRKSFREASRPVPGWFRSQHLHRADLAEYYRRNFDRLAPYFASRSVGNGSVRHVTPITPMMLEEGALRGSVEILIGRCPFPWSGLPDRLSFEVDSADLSDPRGAREATLIVGEFLERLGLQPFVKTSGDRGYHVWTPITQRDTIREIREFELQVILYLVEKLPGLLDGSPGSSGTWMIPGRRETSPATLCPYSARALAGYPISAPLEWAEMRKQVIDPRRYTIKNAFQRLSHKVDPWRDWSEARRPLEGARHELAVLMGRPARVN